MKIVGMEPLALAKKLEEEFGILTRPGLHCAPLAHTHLGTVETGGTTRLSFGAFLNLPEVQYAGDALAQIALEQVGAAGAAK
jgi:selenocysteine lyase/cysteine desulfurase